MSETTTYTTRDDAIEAIIAAIEASGEATRDEFDIDQIADAVISTTGEGVSYRFHITDDHDDFWSAVADAAL